jgi:hypothetical protein
MEHLDLLESLAYQVEGNIISFSSQVKCKNIFAFQSLEFSVSIDYVHASLASSSFISSFQ